VRYGEAPCRTLPNPQRCGMPISARKSLRDVSDDKTYCVLGVVNLSPFSKFTLLPLAMRAE
jgi:hypothetical protein